MCAWWISSCISQDPEIHSVGGVGAGINGLFSALQASFETPSTAEFNPRQMATEKVRRTYGQRETYSCDLQ